jgi:predicted permease
MSGLKHACARLLSWFRRDALDREFDEEAQSHLDLAVEDYVRGGMAEADARRLARRKFGSIAASKDAHRDSRGLPWLDGLSYDLRLTLRGLRRDRAFALAAIAMLALAIGLNVTVFTVMNAMVFRGLPLVERSDRVVYPDVRKPSGARAPMSYSDFEAWRSQTQTFAGLAFSGGGGPITFRAGERRPIDMSMQRVSANTFSLLGVQPVLGRDFTPADEAPGARPVVILSHAFWESRFGKRTDVVGSDVEINGAAATIVGVMPEGFVLVYEQNLWMPVVPAPTLAGGVFGRLKDGATRDEARAELDTINRRLQAADPARDRGAAISVLTYSQAHVGPDASLIYVWLWVGAWFVLLIACANLANLTLVRTIGRWRDFSTRLALGAGQWRMMRQIFVESLMLAGVAGALGWWITNWSVRRWAAATASRYLAVDYTIDSGILAYLVALSVAAAMLFSLAPIAKVLQLGVSSALKGDGRGITHGRGKRVASALVAGQMALAIVLLSGAGVLVRSLANIVGAETGVGDPEHVLVGSLRLPSDAYPSAAERQAYFDRLSEQLRTIPGIADESVASHIPVNWVPSVMFEIEGRPTRPNDGEAAQFLSAGSNYFRVLSVPTISGRVFSDSDRLESAPVAVVNQSFVDKFWPGDDPVGKRLRTTAGNQPGRWLTIVGVVANVMQFPSGNDATRQHFIPLVYRPFRQLPMAGAVNNAGQGFRGTNLVLRTNGPAQHVLQAVRAEVQKADPDAILEELQTLKANTAFDRDRMDSTHGELEKHATAAPIFAVMALLLAAIGLYAVIAHSVSQRTNEIGLRMAIGAAAHDIRRLIFREGMRPVALGLIAGLTVSLAVNRVLQSQLVGVSPYDPVTLAAAAVVLILIALLACQIPSRRALRVDPAVALRHE